MLLFFFFLAAFTIYSLTSKYKQYVLGLGAVKGFGIISGKFGFIIKSSEVTQTFELSQTLTSSMTWTNYLMFLYLSFSYLQKGMIISKNAVVSSK